MHEFMHAYIRTGQDLSQIDDEGKLCLGATLRNNIHVHVSYLRHVPCWFDHVSRYNPFFYGTQKASVYV